MKNLEIPDEEREVNLASINLRSTKIFLEIQEDKKEEHSHNHPKTFWERFK